MNAGGGFVPRRKGQAMAHSFKLIVNDDEYNFLKRLAKHDGVTVHKEAQQLFSLQIWEEMQVQEEFMKGGADDVN